MHIGARTLADAIADAYGKPMPERTRAQLAVALGAGSGFAVDGRTVYAVLRNPLTADEAGNGRFVPTLVVGTLPTSKPARKPRTDMQTAAFFRSRYREIGDAPIGHGPCVPYDPTSAIRVGFGGADIEPLVVTFDEREIKWYPLKWLPDGGFVYLIEDGAVTAYQRVATDLLIIQRFAAGDIVNLPDVLSRNGVTAITPAPGEVAIIRQPAPQQ